MVPGRPSPTKNYKPSTAKGSSATTFEKYQKSVSDAWTLEPDELTKEYCILSEDTKVPRRAGQNLARAHKNPIAVVHRHQGPSSSSSAISTALTASATAAITANNNLETAHEDENDNDEVPTKEEPRKVSAASSEKYEYG
jgi:hypothetical protein